MIYDCVVIGGGVIGTAVLDRLAAYKLTSALVEKEDDVASFSTRANSGVVHAGYDCKPGTLKAKFNVRGNSLLWSDAEALNVPHLKCGSIVVADADGLDGLLELKRRAQLNGVEVEIWDRERTLQFEPNVADRIQWSLYAPKAGVVSPYMLAIAYANRAVLNGAEVYLEAPVTAITLKDGIYTVRTPKKELEAKLVINCAGPNGAAVNDMAGAEHYEAQYRRGDYFVLDSDERAHINTVIFPLPSAAGKGILVAPTADGNVLYGPTAVDTVNGDVYWDEESLETIRRSVPLTYKNPAFDKSIRIFSGLRTIIGDDFIVEESKLRPGFISAIGICSPGLTAAPAIAEFIESIVVKKLSPTPKQTPLVQPRSIKRSKGADEERRQALQAEDERYKNIVCHCEQVSEAEIVQAIHSPIVASTPDAVKRRTRAGMGRCQGARCREQVKRIIARELGIPFEQVRDGSEAGIVEYKMKRRLVDGEKASD